MVDSRRRCQCFLGRYSARYLSLVGGLTPKVLDSCADPGTLGWRDLAGATKKQVIVVNRRKRFGNPVMAANSARKALRKHFMKKMNRWWFFGRIQEVT